MFMPLRFGVFPCTVFFILTLQFFGDNIPDVLNTEAAKIEITVRRPHINNSLHTTVSRVVTNDYD